MLLAGQIAALALFAFAGLVLILETIRTMRTFQEAADEFRILRRWLIELKDDCTMSDEKWRELLPICRFADERLACLRQGRIPIKATCEAFVWQMIDDREEEPEDASA